MATLIRAILAPLFEALLPLLLQVFSRPPIKSVDDGPAKLPSIVETRDADLVRRGSVLLRDPD